MKNLELIESFQSLMAEGKQEEAFDLIAKDALWHSDEIGAPWSGIHQGIDAIKAHFGNISGTTKDFARQTHQWIEQGELLIEIGSLSCVLNKTGEPFATEYVCLYTVKSDKIQSYRIFEDSL